MPKWPVLRVLTSHDEIPSKTQQRRPSGRRILAGLRPPQGDTEGMDASEPDEGEERVVHVRALEMLDQSCDRDDGQVDRS